jgi:hypothetical protein
MPPAKKLAAPGDISHDVPFQLLNRRLKTSKPAVSAVSRVALTPEHGGKARAVHEARAEAAPHAQRALRRARLAHDVDRARVLLGHVLGLHELQLELALNRFCGVGDGGAGVSESEPRTK